MNNLKFVHRFYVDGQVYTAELHARGADKVLASGATLIDCEASALYDTEDDSPHGLIRRAVVTIAGAHPELPQDELPQSI